MVSLQSQLSGPNAFYHQPNYLKKTTEDFKAKGPLGDISYEHQSEDYQSESTVYKIGKIVLSIIIFPIGLYYALHALIGRLVIPSTYLSGCHLTEARQASFEENSRGGWHMKRISIKVNGSNVDAVIMGKASTLGNGRWLLPSAGNGESYEMIMCNSDYTALAEELNSNILFFNYADRWFPTRTSITNCYKAMLACLEDNEKGLAAKEIVLFGRSLGGGVQGRALLNHPLKKDRINYVAVKSQTFSTLSTTVSSMCCFLYGSLIKVAGWEMDSVESSKQLQCPEVIIQTVDFCKHQDVEEPIIDSEAIASDDVISPEAAHATALLSEPGMAQRPDKAFVGVFERHNEPIRSHLPRIARKINTFLQEENDARRCTQTLT